MLLPILQGKGGIALTLPTVCIKIGFLSMFIQFRDPSEQVPKIPDTAVGQQSALCLQCCVIKKGLDAHSPPPAP